MALEVEVREHPIALLVRALPAHLVGTLARDYLAAPGVPSLEVLAAQGLPGAVRGDGDEDVGHDRPRRYARHNAGAADSG